MRSATSWRVRSASVGPLSVLSAPPPLTAKLILVPAGTSLGKAQVILELSLDTTPGGLLPAIVVPLGRSICRSATHAASVGSAAPLCSWAQTQHAPLTVKVGFRSVLSPTLMWPVI
jgi:hypothetical protein